MKRKQTRKYPTIDRDKAFVVTGEATQLLPTTPVTKRSTLVKRRRTCSYDGQKSRATQQAPSTRRNKHESRHKRIPLKDKHSNRSHYVVS